MPQAVDSRSARLTSRHWQKSTAEELHPPDSSDEAPALPGCYSQGESIDDLMAKVGEAITGVLDVMKEHGARPKANIQILDVAV